MGVRGLTSFVKGTSLSSVADHVAIENDSIVVVDGLGLVFFLCQQHPPVSVINPDYTRLRARAVEWVRRVAAAGVGLVIVFDGAIEENKLPCKMGRMSTQARHVHEAVSGLIIAEDDREPRLPSTPPLLAVSCVLGALHYCIKGGVHCRAMFADFEADGALVHCALEVSATAILSNDSDLFIFNTQQVGICHFDGFGFANDDGSMHAWIIRRAKIAALLGIDVAALPFLAALAGHDVSDAATCDVIQRAFLCAEASDESHKRARTSTAGKAKGSKTAKERERERRRAHRKQEASQRDSADQRPPPLRKTESAHTTIKAAAAFLKQTAASAEALNVANLSAALSRDEEGSPSYQRMKTALQTAEDYYLVPQAARVRCCFCGGSDCACGDATQAAGFFDARVRRVVAPAAVGGAPLSPHLQQLRTAGRYIARTSCASRLTYHGGVDTSGGYALLRAFRQQTYATVLSPSSSSSSSSHSSSTSKPSGSLVVTEILRSEGQMAVETCPVAVGDVASVPCHASLFQIHRWVSSCSPWAPLSDVTGDASTVGGDPARQLALIGLAVDLFCSCYCCCGDGDHAPPATWLVPAVSFVIATSCTLQSDGSADDDDDDDDVDIADRDAVQQRQRMSIAYIDAWALLQLCVLHLNDAVEALEARPQTGLDVGLLDETRFRRSYFTLTAVGTTKLLCATAQRELGAGAHSAALALVHGLCNRVASL
jgi:hypothetical protein